MKNEGYGMRAAGYGMLDSADLLFHPSSFILHPSNDPEALKKTAHEFEALFLNHLVKTMHDTIGESELFGGGLGADTYRDMMFQELSRRLAQGGGIGLAQKIIEHLQSSGSAAAPAAPSSGPVHCAPVNRPNDYGVPSRPAPALGDVTPRPAVPASEASFILPVQGRQSSGYGLRSHPIRGDIRFHRGVDIAAPKDAPVVAARSGRIVFSGYQAGYGNTVVVDHADGYRTRYAHMQTIQVSVDEAIRQGDLLGRVGQTGSATGPHLHFEIWHDDVPIDPRERL